MISVINNDFKINRNPNPNSAPDVSFFSIDSPNENRISTDPQTESQDLEESRARVRVSTGDMVWGKVKSHPWWPGHIFNESFVSSSVRRTKGDDFCLVAFFGDSSYGWFDPAELIPYELNFVEKAKQTTQKSFVKAIDESIDEMSRRAALGISCRCQNPYNFRPTRVPNYYEVDVVGYERNGIYSRKQIVKEREGFEPRGVVGFLKKLAVAMREGETKDMDWYRNVAAGLALRRAMFEEFDVTYAQAFGQEPVRPIRDEMGVREQAESFAPRVAPLSGPLVIAEALGNKKSRPSSITKHSSFSSSSSPKLKDKSISKKKKKKDNFVLKRREDHHHIASAAAAPPPPPPAAANNSSASLSNSYSSSALASEYVLQKREPPIDQDTKPTNVYNLFDNQKPNIHDDEEDEESPRTPPLPSASSECNIAVDEEPTAVKKEKKIKKRALDDVINNTGKQEANIKKKKKLELIEAEVPPRPVSPPTINEDELAQLRLPNLIDDMKSLALNPYFGIERNAPLMARHILLRFRNLVYTKSMVLPLPDETPNAASDAPSPSSKEPKPKPAKLFKRPDDPTKSGHKRASSDRQEEKSEKRIKKITKLKALATEKKSTASSGPPPPAPELETKKPEPEKKKPEPEKKKPETVQRQEPQPPLLPLPPSPTYLIMKFPPRSTLPSVANLKARFARFGPLEVDSIRVFWKSHTCKVLYKHKSDAVKAYSFAKSNDLLGQIQVDYSIREVEAPPATPEPVPPRVEPLTRPVSASAHLGRLKSILKKPGGGDEAAKENRVKFMLSSNGNDNNNKADSPPKSPPLPLQPKSNAFPTAPRPSVATPARLFDPRLQPKDSVDISHQMLSLLLRCNDIVAGLKNLPGFVPYHPL